MTPERWRRLEAVFALGCEASAAERAAVVRARLADDPALADEVLSLLDSIAGSDAFLDGLAGRLPLDDDAAIPDSSGSQVGAYRLTRLLGHGGMGSVYLAERTDGAFEQTVAVKLLPLAALRPALERRFREERRILATMQHPHIARLLDGGVAGDGTPYFVMEYVDGLALDDYCNRHAPSIGQRLRLVLDVCDAVEAAHRNLVIHRDLKPANVLVTADGTVKLLDFGIAKLLSADGGTTQAQPMSPAYASPEQLQGGPLTTAVDVWGLGVVLYELLAGRRPFDERDFADRSPPPPPGRYRRDLPRDLDVIIMKAIQPEPERRFASVSLLADDIRRHLEGRPIRARAESWLYRLGCFARRHRYGVAAATAIVWLLAALSVMSLQSATRAREQAARIAIERDASRQVSDFLVEVFAAADPAAARGETVTARELLDRGAERVRTEMRGHPQTQATLQGTIGRVYRQLGLLDRATPLLEEALAQRRRLFAAPHPALAESLHELALARWSAGQPERALPLVRQALAMRETLPGAANTDTLASRIALGRLLTETGHPGDAVRELQAAVRQLRTLDASTRPMLASGLFHLAMASHHDGRMREAGAGFREAAALYRRLPMEPTPESAESVLMVAGLESMDKLDSTVAALYADALRAHRRLYGAGHPRYADALRASAFFDQRVGDLARAETRLAQAVRIHARQRVPERAELASTLVLLGEVRSARGHHDAAERTFEQAVEVGHDLAEPTANALFSLARIDRSRGRLAQAAQRLDRAAQLFRQALGPDNPALPRIDLARGQVAHARGRHEDARILLREAVKGNEALLGPRHVEVARARLALGTCLFEDGDAAQARPLLAAAEQVLRGELGADAAETRRATAMLRR